jgi:hypothetical protein
MYELIGHGSSNMTSLQGYYVATYDELVSVFGEPTYNTTSGDDKVDVEWDLEFWDACTDSTVVATIYNWKDYDGGVRARSGVKYEWHIGGTGRNAVWAVEHILNEVLEPEAVA